MRRFLLLFVPLIIAGCPTPSDDDDATDEEPLPEIQHNEVTSGSENEAVDLVAVVAPPAGREDEVASLLVEVFFRETGTSDFASFEMSYDEGLDQYMGTIAGEEVSAAGVDYYLQAIWVDVSQTHPVGAPDSVHSVVVDAAALQSPAPVRAKYEADSDTVEVTWTAPGTALFTGYTVVAELEDGTTEEVCSGAEADLGCSVDASGVYGTEYASWTVEFTGEDGSTSAEGTTDNLHLYVDHWGKEVSGPTDLPFGTAIGEFNLPFGIEAVGGRVWVAEQSNHRVQVFSPGGTHQATYGSLVGIPGDGASAFNGPSDVTLGPSNEVFIADLVNARVSVWSGGTDTAVRRFGSLGPGDEQFNGPGGVAFDSDGVLHVSESTNGRVSMWEPGGVWIGNYNEVAGEPMDRPNRIEYVAELDAMVILDGDTVRIHGLGEDSPDGNVTVIDGSSESTLAGVCANSWGELLLLIDGGQITVGSDGHRILKIDISGDEVGGFGEWGNGEYEFFRPADCAVNEDGDLYVADALNHRVIIYGP